MRIPSVSLIAKDQLPVAVSNRAMVRNANHASADAATASNCAGVPLIDSMANRYWWTEDQRERDPEAFQEWMLPQATVLVGSHSTLWRWLSTRFRARWAGVLVGSSSSSPSSTHPSAHETSF
jgi:hypothetical protein